MVGSMSLIYKGWFPLVFQIVSDPLEPFLMVVSFSMYGVGKKSRSSGILLTAMRLRNFLALTRVVARLRR